MVGGFGDDAKRTDVNVVYANGTVKDFKWRRLSYRYPKVKAGSTVVVGKRPERRKKNVKNVSRTLTGMNSLEPYYPR
jgi:hypothetical protein